jgi:hypothetical protein
MDQQRRDFLARAALSKNENRYIRARDKPALRLDLAHALAGCDKGSVFIQGNFVDFIVVADRLLAMLLEALVHSHVNVSLPKRLEDYVGGAQASHRHDLFRFGRAGKHNDRKQWLGGAQFREQAQ